MDVRDEHYEEARHVLASRLLKMSVTFGTVSLLSLAIAYLTPFTTMEWNYQFSGEHLTSGLRGFVIEALRSLLFLSVVPLMLYYRFSLESCRFLGILPSNQATPWFRYLFVGMAVLICWIDIGRQLDKSRAATHLVKSVHKRWTREMEKHPEAFEEEDLHKIVARINSASTSISQNYLTYCAYAPYSMINYVFVAIPIIIIWIFTMFFDVPEIHQRFRDILSTEINTSEASSLDDKMTWNQMNSRLLSFREYCILKSTRYIDVFAVFVLSYTFEEAIGRSTLTSDASELQIVTWIPLASVAVAPITCGVFYGAMLERSRWFATSKDILLDVDFDAKFGIASFWKTCFTISMGGYVVILCGIPFLKTLLHIS